VLTILLALIPGSNSEAALEWLDPDVAVFVGDFGEEHVQVRQASCANPSHRALHVVARSLPHSGDLPERCLHLAQLCFLIQTLVCQFEMAQLQSRWPAAAAGAADSGGAAAQGGGAGQPRCLVRTAATQLEILMAALPFALEQQEKGAEVLNSMLLTSLPGRIHTAVLDSVHTWRHA
jgi:hypothetical protein